MNEWHWLVLALAWTLSLYRALAMTLRLTATTELELELELDDILGPIFQHMAKRLRSQLATDSAIVAHPSIHP